ncbi:MAG: RagB/SusD family nutrient uptake outer membrane protein [Salinibacter sp.]
MNDSNTLRHTIVGAALLVACGLVFVSCDMFNGDFLERPARGGLSESVIANTNGGVQNLLNGAYSALTGVQGGTSLGGGAAWFSAQNNWEYAVVGGGLFHKGSVGGDQGQILTIAKHEMDPSIADFNALWKARFEGVSRANQVISLAKQSDQVSESQRTSIIAQARFLRGHFYFELKRNFGRVPYVTDTTQSTNQPNVGPKSLTWDKIKADFQFAKNNLSGNMGEIGRANKWAAAAYLGKVHLYLQEYQQAREEFDAVIQNGTNAVGTPYALTSDFTAMFDPARENNSGVVFAIQNTGNDGSGGFDNSRGGSALNYPHSPSPFGCCGFYQPTQWLVESYRVDPSTGLPSADGMNPAQGPTLKNDQGVSSTTKYDVSDRTVDPRLEHTVGRRGVPYKDWGPHPGARWIREQANGGPYAPKKHIYSQADKNTFGTSNSWGAKGSAIDYHVIRFADVLLMAAEAHVNGGSMSRATDYVNRVRSRAQGDAVKNSDNLAFATAEVTSESAVLSQTGLDAFDWVVRTDNQTTYVYLGTGPESDLSNWAVYDLPDYEVGTYSSLTQGSSSPMEKIMHERKLELAGEGHRLYDLVRRTGFWANGGGSGESATQMPSDLVRNRLAAIYNHESSDNTIGVKNVSDFSAGNVKPIFPVPQRQIDLSTGGLLQQNPQY